MADFYEETIERLLRRAGFTVEMRVLVVCGGERDREALLACGFTDVTISNLDSRMRGDEFAPYRWSYQDAENLTFADDAFDLVLVHSGLHHCHSPHRALLQMYRVARTAVLVFEPRDGVLVGLGVRLNLGQDYEVASVAGNDLAFGGVRNTEIPNYVYRFTESEVRKTIQSNAPYAEHRIDFFYALRVPWWRLNALKSRLPLLGVRALTPLLNLVGRFRWGCNNFAFVVFKPKPDDLFPWLTTRDGKIGLNRPWVSGRYR